MDNIFWKNMILIAYQKGFLPPSTIELHELLFNILTLHRPSIFHSNVDQCLTSPSVERIFAPTETNTMKLNLPKLIVEKIRAF